LRGGARVGLVEAVRLGDADVRQSISLLIQSKQPAMMPVDGRKGQRLPRE
jgi:hypothetical protein